MLFPVLAANMNATWWLLPLTVTVSLVYNATRYELPEKILQRSLKMGWAFTAFWGGGVFLLFLLSSPAAAAVAELIVQPTPWTSTGIFRAGQTSSTAWRTPAQFQSSPTSVAPGNRSRHASRSAFTGS